MTQEEFEKIVDKTYELAMKGDPTGAVTYWWNNNVGEFYEADSGEIVWKDVIFKPFDSKLKEVVKTFPLSSAEHLLWNDQNETTVCEEFQYVLGESLNRYQSLLFATYGLNTIQEHMDAGKNNPNELFQQNRGDCNNASPWYLLANPRKEVVEWALTNFDYKSYQDTWIGFDFIEDRQAIPELKELIRNTLEKKGEEDD